MEKILIVDDSIVQATQLMAILADEYDVTIAQTAEEGLRHVSSESYSLILLDVVMPGMDGFTLLKKLQEEIVTQSIPVILITSLSDVEHEQYGLVLGAVDYISKPFNPHIVRARVNTHIKLYDYRREVELRSMTDQLTGIANRRRYEGYSVEKWHEAVRLKIPFSVCMFDIDHFKRYNDTFGHPAGDKVIAAVARTVASLRIAHDPSVAEWVTVSVGGVTIVPTMETPYSVYLKIADTMLYDAKKHGRNQVVWADEGMKQLWEK